MNAYTEAKDFGVTSEARSNWVSVTETYWGYVIRSDAAWSSRAQLIERVSALAGVALMVVGCGHWLFPEVHAAVDGTPHRVFSTMGLCVAGLVFLWVAARGLSHELQVDMTLQCLRRVVRNRRGRTRIAQVVPFEEVASAFVKRSSAPGGSAHLFVRLKDGKSVVRVATGRPDTLQVLNERMSRDIVPVKTQLQGWHRVGRKLVPNTPQGATA